MRLLHFISIVFAVATSASLIDIRDSCSRGVCSTTINCCPDLACTIDTGRKIGVCILCYKETNSPIHELYRHANERVHAFRKYHHINVDGSPGKGWTVEMTISLHSGDWTQHSRYKMSTYHLEAWMRIKRKMLQFEVNLSGTLALELS